MEIEGAVRQGPADPLQTVADCCRLLRLLQTRHYADICSFLFVFSGDNSYLCRPKDEHKRDTGQFYRCRSADGRMVYANNVQEAGVSLRKFVVSVRRGPP